MAGKRWVVGAWVILALGWGGMGTVLADAVGAAPGPQPTTNKKPESEQAKARRLLKAGQLAESAAALRVALETNPREVDDSFGLTGIRTFLDAQRYADVVSLGDQLLCAKAHNLEIVENCLKCQVRALQALGKHAEALAKAKSYYNVCGMVKTAEAFQMIKRELRFVKPELVARLEQEQAAGTEAPEATAPATTAPAKAGSVLAGIKVDAAPFEAALRGVPEENLRALAKRGNLLLLTDRASEAAGVFERAHSMAKTPLDMQRTSEGVARCMKAQDGSVGRANAWILSLQQAPKKK